MNDQELYIRSSIQLTGIRIEIDYLFNSSKTIFYYPKSKLIYNKDNILKLAIEHIEKKYYYPKGLFKSIQLYKNCNKQDAIDFYKNFVCPTARKRISQKYLSYDSDQTNKAILRRLRDKNNINLINSLDVISDYSKLKSSNYKKPTKVNSRLINLTYQDIEDYCYYEGIEVDEESIFECIDAIENNEF